jgi:hypothetical protein
MFGFKVIIWVASELKREYQWWQFSNLKFLHEKIKQLRKVNYKIKKIYVFAMNLGYVVHPSISEHVMGQTTNNWDVGGLNPWGKGQKT